MRFTDVGHLLGSTSISLRIAEPGRAPEIIVFSGDIGNQHQPLIKDPATPGHADYLVMESTYGDRSHGPKPDYLGELTAVLQSTSDKGGNVVIPSFAVGRTQELLYFFRQIKAEKRVKGHDNFPVFVDSPLASKSTTIFRENFAECYDDEALCPGAERPEPAAVPGAAHQRDERGIHGHQRRPDAESHYLRRRYVRCGPHSPSPEIQPLAAGVHGAVRRLPKPGHPGQCAGQWRTGGQALRRAGAGQGPHCAAGRAFESCGL